MGNVTIYPRGTADITVPAGQSIAISNFGGGIAQIYYLITAANAPPAFQFQQILENSSVTLGAFSAETIVRIEANNRANNSKVIYDVGVSPDTGIGDADTLNGLPSDTADTADTIAARDSSGDIQANAFESTVATGTPPLTVASTTVVPNLNVSQLEGRAASYFAVATATAYLAATQNFSGINAFTAGSFPIQVTTTSDAKIRLSNSSNPYIQFQELSTNKAAIQWINAGYLFIINQEDGSQIRLKDDLDFSPDGGANRYSIWHAGNNPSVGAGNGISGSFTTTDGKTVTVTNGIITAIV